MRVGLGFGRVAHGEGQLSIQGGQMLQTEITL